MRLTCSLAALLMEMPLTILQAVKATGLSVTTSSSLRPLSIHLIGKVSPCHVWAL